MQSSNRPVQILDAIDFEEKFKHGKIKRFTEIFENTPENVDKVIQNVPSNEKRHIMTTYTMSSLGLGIGCTIGVILKFIAPIAIGGAGLKIATTVMIGLTGGAGLLAIGLAYFVHKFYTKEAIKNTGILLWQIEATRQKKRQKAGELLEKMNEAFGMLLEMKVTLEQLKRLREQRNPKTFPSSTEVMIKERINNYINFLVKNPTHPNFNKIENSVSKINERVEADRRQKHIKAELDKACLQMLNENNALTLDERIKAYRIEHKERIRHHCFPLLELDAPRTKPPRVITNPLIGFSFLGTFSGTFGLSYLSLTLISTFTAVSMAFPPLYAILGLAFSVAIFTAYNVYKTKKKEALRNTEKKDEEKLSAYYYQNIHYLDKRYTLELREFKEYHAKVIESYYKYQPPVTLTKEPAPPELEDEKNMTSVSKTGLSIYDNFNPSSTQNLASVENENLNFHEPSKVSSTVSCPA